MTYVSRAMARFPWLWLCILGLLWGANFLFMKNAAHLGATLIVWFRLLFGALVLTPIIPAALKKIIRSPKPWLHLLVMSLSANVLTFHCFMEGTRRLGTGTAGVISGSIPLMTALLASILLPDERFTRRSILGLLLSFSGIVLIMAPKVTGSHDVLSGTGYMLVGALGYAVAFVYARRFLTPGDLSPLELAALQMAMATILYAPLVNWSDMTNIRWNWMFFGNVVLGLGMFGSGLAYVIYYGLIEAIGAISASSVTYLPPLVALGLGWTALHEPMHLYQTTGTAMVLAGIFIIRKNRQKISPGTIR